MSKNLVFRFRTKMFVLMMKLMRITALTTAGFCLHVIAVKISFERYRQLPSSYLDEDGDERDDSSDEWEDGEWREL